MKKTIAILIVFIILSQFCFSVYAEDTPVFVLDQNSMAVGADLSEGGYRLTDTATMKIDEDANGKFVAVRDHDDSVDAGYFKNYTFDGIDTITFDYRNIKGSPNQGRLYVGLVITLFLNSSPRYYDGKQS